MDHQPEPPLPLSHPRRHSFTQAIGQTTAAAATSPSFSYQDLVLSSRFERLTRQPIGSLLLRAGLPPALSSSVPSTPIRRLSSERSYFHFSPQFPASALASAASSAPSSSSMPLDAAGLTAATNAAAPSSLTPRRSSQSFLSPIELHPAVASRLRLYWCTLLQRGDGLLSQEEYSAFYVKLSKLLLCPHFSLQLAMANAAADWQRDMQYQAAAQQQHPPACLPSTVSMTQSTFTHSLYEVIDAYTHLQDPAQYVFLLNKLYCLLTAPPPPLPPQAQPQPQLLFLALTQLDGQRGVNGHTDSNFSYNARVHRCAALLSCPVHDADVAFTMPLLPLMSAEPTPASAFASSHSSPAAARCGIKQGPSRCGVKLAFAAMEECWTARSPLEALLPWSWSLQAWQQERSRAAGKEAAGMEEKEQGEEATVPMVRQRRQERAGLAALITPRGSRRGSGTAGRAMMDEAEDDSSRAERRELKTVMTAWAERQERRASSGRRVQGHQ